ncbi:MAG: 30S ribosome-binding factor RbfA [Saprospiraceae bacterium]|nr:30S ribosome-binding factor RbfA [Saprospiraceae bacterium]
MKQETKKQRQVAATIQKEFSTVLQQEGYLIYGNALVTVTRVRMSSDMGIAYIYLSVYGTLYKQEVIKQMWDNLQRLRGGLGRRVRKQLRRVPMIKFFIDDTLDQAEHLDNLFAEMNKNKNMQDRSMRDALKDKENETSADEQQENE